MSFFNNKLREDFKNFNEFASEFRVPDFNQKDEQFIRIIHKNLYKIHFVNHCIKNQDIYLKEMLSDLLSFTFLSRIGTHKAAMIVLRSSIENFMRFIIHSYLNCNAIIFSKSTFQLFEEPKEYFNTHSHIVDHINKLYSIYSHLCSYSHSALTEFHENHIVFHDLTNISSQEINRASKECEKVTSSILNILYYCYYVIEKKNSSIISNQHRSEFIEILPEEILSSLNPPL